MKSIRTLVLLIPFLSSFASADILEELARNPEVLNAKLSPTGEYLAVLREIDERRTVVTFAFPGLKPMAIMDFPGRNEVGNFWWVNNDRIVASVNFNRDQYESELSWGELFGMNVDGTCGEHLYGLRAAAETRFGHLAAKKNEYGSAYILNQLWDDPRRILIHIRNWNLSGGPDNVVEYAQLDVYTGRIVQRKNAPAPDADLLADQNGEVRFSFSIDAKQRMIIHSRKEGEMDWSEFARIPYGESGLKPQAILDDGRIAVLHEPAGRPHGLYALDPSTKSRTPMFQHDIVDATPEMDFKQNIYGIRIDDGLPKFVATDPNHPSAILITQLQSTFPGRYAEIASTTHDFRLSVVRVSDDNSTPEYYLHDAKTNEIRLLFDTRPWVDDKKLGTTESISITTRDGVNLHGYLTLPPGSSGKNQPLVIVPHGGPHGPRDLWELGWESFIPASGYPMLRINYRGSGGYGTAFEKSGFRKWPQEMQNDLTDAVKWAVEKGIADPNRVCIFGWSYGGFSAVMSIAREPDLYRCSIAGAGVYDQEEQYRNADFADLTRWGRRYMDKVIGDTAEARKAASPITYVDRMKTPLLLIHGEEDARVPVEHSYKLVDAYKAAGKTPPELIVLENEGHGPSTAKNTEIMHRATIAFLEKYLGKP